jgi:ATP-binding cassette, subfamily C, bacterial CydC
MTVDAATTGAQASASTAGTASADGTDSVPAGRDRPLLRLLRHLDDQRAAVARTAVVSFVGGLLIVAVAVLAAGLVGTAVVEGQVAGPGWWGLLAGLALARGAMTWREMDLSHDVAFRVLARLRVALYDGLARSTPRRVGAGHSGEHAATAMGDVERLEFFYAHAVAQAVAAVLLVGLGGAAAAVVIPALAIVLLLAAGLLVASAALAAERMRRWGEQAAAGRGRLSSRVVEVLAGRREVIGYGLAPAVLADLDRLGEEAWRPQRRAAVTGALAQGVRDLVVVAAVAGTVLGASTAAREGDLSPALVPAVVAGVLGLLSPLADLVGSAGQLHEQRAAARRVLAGAEAPAHLPPAPRPRRLPSGPLGIQARGVCFNYGGRFGLGPVDLDVAPGGRVVLVGTSGSGKSTLAHLLTRWFDPLAGTVRLVGRDGTAVDVRDVEEHELRDAVALVGQDVHLFHGTIADNLRRGRPDLTRAAMSEVLHRVGLAELVHSLPDGLDPPLGQRGHRFSGGQRARLALARALLRAPRVLVLDEATAHLDPGSERDITALVQSLDPDLTVITVAHRAATIRASGHVLTVRGLTTTAVAPPQ